VLHNDGSWDPLPFQKDPRSLPPTEQAALAQQRLEAKKARKVETFSVDDDEEDRQRSVSFIAASSSSAAATTAGSSNSSSVVSTCDKESSEAEVLKAAEAAAAAAAEAMTVEKRKRNVRVTSVYCFIKLDRHNTFTV